MPQDFDEIGNNNYNNNNNTLFNEGKHRLAFFVDAFSHAADRVSDEAREEFQRRRR
jgi:hypothetical protein